MGGRSGAALFKCMDMLEGKQGESLASSYDCYASNTPIAFLDGVAKSDFEVPGERGGGGCAVQSHF